MIDEIRHPVIAIDGGGTYCRVAISGTHSTPCVQAGSANVSNNFNESINEIFGALQKLSSLTDIPIEVMKTFPTYAGLAGITGPDMAQKVTNALPFTAIRVSDDRASALRGALGDNDGFIAHCGTGSFMGRQENNTQNLVGGWGPILGDGASAQWIGRRALAKTLETLDGIREQSLLSKSLLNRFGDSANIVKFAAGARPTDFGAIAPEVTTLAEQGDPLAIELLDDGAEVIRTTLVSLGWKTGKPICLTGGIASFFASRLPEEIQHHIQQPVGTPLDGAIALARSYSQELSDAYN